MEDVLIYFAIKYDGDFKKMLEALQTKEQTDSIKFEEYKKDIRHKYVTLISNRYPEYFKTTECTPIVLFYKGNLKLIDEGLPMEYSVLESGKRFISTVYPIKQNGKIVFDYVVGAECQDDLDKMLKHIKDKGIPLKDYYKPKKKQMER